MKTLTALVLTAALVCAPLSNLQAEEGPTDGEIVFIVAVTTLSLAALGGLIWLGIQLANPPSYMTGTDEHELMPRIDVAVLPPIGSDDAGAFVTATWEF